MKHLLRVSAILSAAFLSYACIQSLDDPRGAIGLPPGTPATLFIPFGSEEMLDLTVSTKASASDADEARVHDLYVLIFDNDQAAADGSAAKIYGRYFSFEHQTGSLTDLNNNANEGWYVENKTLNGVSPAIEKTNGAVKVSTVTSKNATVVILANVSNSVTTFDDGSNSAYSTDISYLNGIQTLNELRGTKVILEQDVVNRKDLFLMMGELTGVDTRNMAWGELPKEYDQHYKLSLEALDAKVTFLVKSNPEYISEITPVYWQICNMPDRCYLFEDYNGGAAPDDILYFDSEQAYFEGVETIDGEEWYAFTFYMLENRQAARANASSYHDRESQYKENTGESGYRGPGSEQFGQNYVNNTYWLCADSHAAYAKFDMVLSLTPEGVKNITGTSISNAMTSDAIFTVHLGNFGASSGNGNNYNDYNTLRSHYYRYKIEIKNTGSIYAEVETDEERQPGQEGYLLLTNEAVIQADAHYEYHSLTFDYSAELNPDVFSWYVKTPFGEGGPVKKMDPDDNAAYLYTADNLDYKWVMFTVNHLDNKGDYSDNRRPYPGINSYDESWKPSSGNIHPDLMDINQLIEYIFDQTKKKTAGQSNDFDNNRQIKVTVYIDEYYYEENPLSPGEPDPDLWRRFVNANPREIHILSDARSSRDRKSDVIESSHSIIQQSIQTIYNIYAPNLRTLWGCEHLDENKRDDPDGWPYWPETCPDPKRSGADTELGRENGRLNSAYIWGIYNSKTANGSEKTNQEWNTYMDYNVPNNTPELREAYQGMAWSCLSRNRDNNGNGTIDRDEVRWYLPSSRQLTGMWVGNESLSLSARLYQPAKGQWRAHILSSTAEKVCWSEEGAGATDLIYDVYGAPYNTWSSWAEAAKGESVRCVRNIGTYDEGGKVTDISSAPYQQEVDKYFELIDNEDNSYTFKFDRLDSKSLREYSDGELPFHDQKSLTNRVYVSMVTQSRDDDVDAFNKKMGEINTEVTKLGYNPYCPPGYRFPNHTEWVLMSLYLPNSYLQYDKDGKAYPSTGRMPSRTYYDRGYFGSLRADNGSVDWYTERNKVGWMFSNKLHCSPYEETLNHSRCVRDDNATGQISGGVSVDGTYLFPSERQKVTFNFSSTASSFTAASLKLCYTAHSGNYREVDIPVAETPTGLQYRKEQTVSIPSLNDLGLTLDDLAGDGRDVVLQAQVRNAVGYSYTYDLPLKFHSHIIHAAVDFPSVFDETKGIPVRAEAKLGGTSAQFNSITLKWQINGGEEGSMSLDAGSVLNYKDDIFLKDNVVSAGDLVASYMEGKKFTFWLEASCNDGTSLVSPKRSMTILRWKYDPNPAPAGGWTASNTVSQISKTWQDRVDGVSFAGGDYLEAEMDLRNCYYVYTNQTGSHNQDKDLGKDNIFGFSTDNVGSITNSILWYYPTDHIMDPNPENQGSPNLRVHAGKWAALNTEGARSRLNLILDKDGIKQDGARFTGNPGNWNSTIKPALTRATTVYLGSKEGSHHSRAIYNYVRFIHNEPATP